MDRMTLINLYGQGIADRDTSPFEMLETFHISSELHQLSLTSNEKNTSGSAIRSS